jgi:uncharacterized membrane protein
MNKIVATVYLLANMALLPVMASLTARLSRAGHYFGVTVDPGFPETPEGRRILRRFRRRLWIYFVLGSAVVAAGVLKDRTVLVAAGLVWQVVRVLWSFWDAHRQALPHAVPATSVREASLAPRSASLPGGIPGQAGPFVLLLATAAWLSSRWDAIPARYPIHWGLDGRLNGWSERTFSGVYGPLLTAGLVLAVLLGLAQAILTSSRDASERSRRANLVVLLAVEFLVAMVAAFAACLPLIPKPLALLPVALGVPVVATVAIFLYMVRVAREVRPQGSDGTPDRYWPAGLVYVNRGDPALLVPKRFGIGYTLNFGNPRAWLVLAAIVALLLLPLLLAL